MKLSNTIKTGCPPTSKPNVPYAENKVQQMAPSKLTAVLYPNPTRGIVGLVGLVGLIGLMG
jgi:hypothetical protein